MSEKNLIPILIPICAQRSGTSITRTTSGRKSTPQSEKQISIKTKHISIKKKQNSDHSVFWFQAIIEQFTNVAILN